MGRHFIWSCTEKFRNLYTQHIPFFDRRTQSNANINVNVKLQQNVLHILTLTGYTPTTVHWMKESEHNESRRNEAG